MIWMLIFYFNNQIFQKISEELHKFVANINNWPFALFLFGLLIEKGMKKYFYLFEIYVKNVKKYSPTYLFFIILSSFLKKKRAQFPLDDISW